MFKNISRYFYFSFIPILFLSAITIVLFATGVIPTYYILFTLIGWTLFDGLGVATGYHRIFSHRNFLSDLPKWKENFILLCGALSGQGDSISWVAIHRGSHHKHSDTEKDLHSPIHGLWHAFVGWTLPLTENNFQKIIPLKYAADLLRRKNHIFFHRFYFYILWGIPLIVALFNWHLALALFTLPAGISLLNDNLVNVVCHLKSVGYRNFDTKDNSNNNLFFGYFGWGQGWHNNHHAKPNEFDFGKKTSGKWWEFDPCRIFLPFLKGKNKK